MCERQREARRFCRKEPVGGGRRSWHGIVGGTVDLPYRSKVIGDVSPVRRFRGWQQNFQTEWRRRRNTNRSIVRNVLGKSYVPRPYPILVSILSLSLSLFLEFSPSLSISLSSLLSKTIHLSLFILSISLVRVLDGIERWWNTFDKETFFISTNVGADFFFFFKETNFFSSDSLVGTLNIKL